MNPRLLRQLQAVDWDFPRNDTESTSAIHWYPGTFPSQLPGTMVEALSEDVSLIFDPYGGIGTTAVEALRLGRKGWCVDQNPIGSLASYIMAGLILAKALDYPMPFPTLLAMERIIIGPLLQSDLFTYSDESSIDLDLEQLIRPIPREMLAALSCKMPSNWDSLRPWFEPNTLQAVKKIHARLMSSELSSFGKLVGLLMISACLRPACSQTRSWGHIADNVLPSEYEQKDFPGLCKRWLCRACGILARTRVTPIPTGQKQAIRVWVSCHDWRTGTMPSVRPNRKCDLLITSPPYSGAIDYTRAQRLSLYLLGWTDHDIITLGNSEIGARRKRSKALSESDWANELGVCLKEQLSFLSPRATAVIVLPHEDHGRKEGSVRLGEVFREANWERVFSVDRSIRQVRTRQSWTSIKMETVEMFQKGGEDP